MNELNLRKFEFNVNGKNEKPNIVIYRIREIREANKQHISVNGVAELNSKLRKSFEQQVIITVGIVFHILIAAQVVFFRHYWFCAVMLVETGSFMSIMVSDLKRTQHGEKKQQVENEEVQRDAEASIKGEEQTFSSSASNNNKKVVAQSGIDERFHENDFS